MLKPHYQNFNKTIVKRPKLYFYDSALVCNLLGIQNTLQLSTHPLRGAIFEGMVISELVKNRTNKGFPINLYYWRDKTGHEIDIIIDKAGKLVPLEIKSGKTISPEFYKNINYWRKISEVKKSVILYAGEQEQKYSDGKDIINWREFIFNELV